MIPPLRGGPRGVRNSQTAVHFHFNPWRTPVRNLLTIINKRLRIISIPQPSARRPNGLRHPTSRLSLPSPAPLRGAFANEPAMIYRFIRERTDQANRPESPTSIPFGLPHQPKTPHLSEPQTLTKKTNTDRPNGTSNPPEQEETKKHTFLPVRALAGTGFRLAILFSRVNVCFGCYALRLRDTSNLEQPNGMEVAFSS